MSDISLSRGHLMKVVFTRFAGAILLLVATFFLPAGTWDYWQAWAYLAVLLVPLVFVLSYLLRNDPALLERRMRTREPEAQQALIIRLSFVWFLLEFLIPGFDKRLGWSHVPTSVVVAADALVFLGYLFVFFVFRENSYASRVVEVESDQRVISSGPYSIVRHPMYLGVCVMYLLTPLALASYWAIIPALSIIPVLVARIRNEEMVLLQALKGYAEYRQLVRYRLLPGVW
jgi:protein-S-isoprenylcysteine O-methyltransferase Ste14